MAYERIDIEVTDNGSSRRVQRNLEELGRTGRTVVDGTIRIIREGLDAVGPAGQRAFGSASSAAQSFGGILRDLQNRLTSLSMAGYGALGLIENRAYRIAVSFAAMRSQALGAQVSITGMATAGYAALALVEQRADAAAAAIGRMGQTAAGVAQSFGQRALGAAPIQLQQLGQAAQGAAGRLAAAGGSIRNTMSSVLGSIRSGASSAAQAVSNMFGRFFGGGGGGGGGGGAASAAGGAARGVNAIEDAARRASSALITMNTLMYSLQIGMIAVAAVKWADEWQNIQNKLDLVTRSSEELANVNRVLFETAQRTRTGYAEVVELFQSLRLQAANLGLSMKATADLTETVAMAAQIGSRGPQQAAAGVLQLTQALALGRLSGQNLNSVLQATPRIAIAVAEGLGVTTAALRKMAEDEKLTADVLVKALQGQSGKIAEEFLKLKPTIGGAFTVLNNGAIEFMGRLEASTGFASGLASAIIFLSKNMDVLAAATAAVGSALMVAFGGAVRRAIMATTAAIAANPIGAIIALVTSLTAAVVFLGDRWSVSADGAVSALDWIKGALSIVWDMIVGLGALISSVWSGMSEDTGSVASAIWGWFKWAFLGIVNIVKWAINAVIGTFVFGYKTIVALWNGLGPAIQDGFAMAANWIAKRFEGLINGIIDGLNKVNLFSGLTGDIGHVSFGVDNPNAGAANGLRNALGSAAKDSYTTDYLGEAWNYTADTFTMFGQEAMRRGRGYAARRKAAEGTGELDDTPGTSVPYATDDDKKKASRQLSRAEIIAAEMKRIHDETVTAANVTYTYLDRAAYEAIDKFNAGLRQRKDKNGNPFAVLNADEEKSMLQALLGLDKAKRLQEARDQVMRESIGPRLQYLEAEEAINQLLKAQAISAEEATRALRKRRMEYLAAKTDGASGLERGRLYAENVIQDGAGERNYSAYTSQWDAANKGVLELQANFAALKQLLIDDPIHSGRYNLELNKLKQSALELKVQLGDATFFETLAAGFGKLVEGYEGVLPGLMDSWGEFFNTFADGFAESVGRAIVYGENLGTALGDVAREAIAGLISALVKLGIQWLVMEVIGKTAMASTAATGAVTGAATAAAWAPAAAAVSLATFGANAGPAMAGIGLTYGLTSALSMMGGVLGFAEGGRVRGAGTETSDSILARLSNGEFVVNAAATRQFLPMLEAINSGRTPPSMAFAYGGYVDPAGLSRAAYAAPIVSGGSAPAPAVPEMSVSIQNFSSAEVEVERVGPASMRVQVKEELRKQLPGAMAGAIRDPSSRPSKALGTYTKTRRKRT